MFVTRIVIHSTMVLLNILCKKMGSWARKTKNLNIFHDLTEETSLHTYKFYFKKLLFCFALLLSSGCNFMLRFGFALRGWRNWFAQSKLLNQTEALRVWT